MACKRDLCHLVYRAITPIQAYFAPVEVMQGCGACERLEPPGQALVVKVIDRRHPKMSWYEGNRPH